MKKFLRDLVENPVPITEFERYCAIIGKNPSEGARSPLLWNAVFDRINEPLRMIPLDVTKDNIRDFLRLLDQDDNFVAGAVAVPYKEIVFEHFFSRLDSTTKKIGAVNCLYRDDSGRLTAINTDGEGAISSLKDNFVGRNYEKALVLGSGGTAKAVSAFLSSSLNLVNDLVIASRSEVAGVAIAKKCSARWVDWNNIGEEIKTTDLVINCTTLGSKYHEAETPLKDSDFGLMLRRSVIFDVVYDPAKTLLLKIAEDNDFETLNGLGMNLEQAVIACAMALKGKIGLDGIREIMELVD